MKQIKFLGVLFLVLYLSGNPAFAQRFIIQHIQDSRTEMDSTWDPKSDPKLIAFVNSYKEKLQAEMNGVIGTAAQSMDRGFPQSLLTNLTADVMRQYGIDKMGGADFAVVNVHGHRASLSQGAITIGNLFEIYSFDNKLVLLELDGKAVRKLFDFFALNGGEGLSKGVRLKVQNKKVVGLEISGSPLDENHIYRVATLDYLAEGNGGMDAFTQAKKYTDSGVTLRDIMIDYVKKCTEDHKPVDSALDDRITIEK